jgi:hypothetical protein
MIHCLFVLRALPQLGFGAVASGARLTADKCGRRQFLRQAMQLGIVRPSPRRQSKQQYHTGSEEDAG